MHRRITLGPGWIRVGPRPRGGDWLEIDIANLRSESFSFVVSMLTDAENQELGLEHEKAVCDELKIDFYSFPILDRSIPGDRREFEAFANRLLRRTKAGEAGFLHCRAGLGRAPPAGVHHDAFRWNPTWESLVHHCKASGSAGAGHPDAEGLAEGDYWSVDACRCVYKTSERFRSIATLGKASTLKGLQESLPQLAA